MKADGLHLLALGGAGEIGMNLTLYAHAGRWLMVDCGVMFERDGLEQHVLYPDVSFIEAHRRKLEGLVLTHAHQDHLGAVADVWDKLRCRVYATPFAAAMLHHPLRERGLVDRVPLRVVGETARIRLGPFDVERIPMTHSTVEMGALAIRTDAGTVLHTGDFKLDPDPVVGRVTHEARLRQLGDAGLLACVSDSTNADLEGWTPSEGAVAMSLAEVLRGRPGRIAVPLFATNVARLATLTRIGHALGRHVVLLGRSLERTVRAARRAGYLHDLPPFVPAREFGYLPPASTLLLCTGTQGEPQAALSRLADGTHPLAYLDPGDTVVFSARRIPGNEPYVARVVTLLGERGVEVVTPEDAFVHVSGHPRRDELRELYRWIRPARVVPVHGTPPKLEAHAALAEDMGAQAVRIRNGTLVRLDGDAPRVVRRIRTGRLRRRAPPVRR